MATSRAIATRTRYIRVKSRRHSRAKFNIPLGIVAGFAPLAIEAYGWYRAGGVTQATQNLVQNLTGYDSNLKQWQFQHLVHGWAPIIAGVAVHAVANRMGINRRIRKIIPWISI